MAITGNDIVADLRSEFLEPSPTFVSQARMLALINQAQNNYVRLTRVLQSFAYTSTVQGQADYPMPADWLGSEKVFYNATVDGTTPNWRPLTPISLEKLGQQFPNFLSADPANQAQPRFCYVIGSTLYLYPRPAQDGFNDIFLFYEAKPIQLLTLSDSLSIDDSLYQGVRAYVLSKLWRQDNEDAKADREMSGDMKKPGNFENEVGNGFKWKNKRILDGKWQLDIQSYVPFSYNGFGATGNLSGNGANPLNQ